MGPPSRYALLYSTPPRDTLPAPALIPAEDDADTVSLTNTEWAKYHFTRLATAASDEEFAERADAAFARHVNITMNGVHLSRALYAQQWGAAFGAGGSITFSGAIETPNVSIPALENAALVGLLYDLIFSATDSHLSAVGRSNVAIATDLLDQPHDKTLSPTMQDRRRIVSVNQVLVDKDGMLTFPLRDFI
ncbi:hypothetical protein DFH11DRAFT_1726579 [Phellopilus nigrolimitatus]|nr:hypothetical protein DFH11DRAFT_1726579 [Phellopilus nigrolimitatus]